jgi:hypothetical protein
LHVFTFFYSSLRGAARNERRRVARNDNHSDRAAVTSTSSLNSGRVNPDTITKVELKASPAT